MSPTAELFFAARPRGRDRRGGRAPQAPWGATRAGPGAMSPEANQGANPAAAAKAAAFDREVFREALLTRSMNQTTSARAAILPTNESIVQTPRATPRPMTDRYPLNLPWTRWTRTVATPEDPACVALPAWPFRRTPCARPNLLHSRRPGGARSHRARPSSASSDSCGPRDGVGAGRPREFWSPRLRAPSCPSVPCETWANCRPARQ